MASDAIREAIARATFIEFGNQRLAALCQAATEPSVFDQLSQLFARMLGPWAGRTIGVRPPYRSCVADDEAPFEFSLALSEGAAEVQFYVEALGEPPNAQSNMRAGRALLEVVASQLNAPLGRLRQVEDLFFPHDPQGTFTIWLGASCAAGRRPQLKVYLNPQVRGRAGATQLLDEAMARLGFTTAWSSVRRALSSDPGRLDELAIVSLDLSSAMDARAKIYVRQHGATTADIAALAGTSGDAGRADAALFHAALGCGSGPFLRRPPITELAFTEPGAASPSTATLEFPIGSYVSTDEVARERVERCLTAFGLPTQQYQAALRAFATRPLAERSGIHAHVTLRRDRGGPRIAIYFASEAYVNARHPAGASYHGME